MISFKRLSECTFAEAVDLWNRGFEGYYFPMTTNAFSFVQRMGNEGLSPDLSVVAVKDGQIIGFVLNGTRVINGKKVAWNGGTGVVPEYRHQGVGKALMKEVFDVYQSEGVAVATLEAISANVNAINLYEQMGYEVVDQLHFYYHTEPLRVIDSGVDLSVGPNYFIKKGVPHDVQLLSFYRAEVAWQTQWVSVRDGESLIVTDGNHDPVGYALYKRTRNEEGQLSGIHLYQAEVKADQPWAREIYIQMLKEVYNPLDLAVHRGTVNTPVSNHLLTSLLLEWGFTSRAEQVYMKYNMDNISG